MNSFVSAMDGKTRKPVVGKMTLTENLALTYKSTGTSVLDFFAKSGALRGDIVQFVDLFRSALMEDALLGLRALFQARDIRGGNGERKNFRAGLFYLANHEPAILRKNLHLVPEYGRWDDLWILLNTFLAEDVIELVRVQLEQDYRNFRDNKPISLLAKWLPSENTSSKETRADAYHIRTGLGASSRQYRKMLSNLRAYLNVVERDMSARNFAEIDYSQVPSQAMRVYRNAFSKRDEERFGAFLGQVEKGEVEIKTGTLSPVQIMGKMLSGYREEDRVLEALWNNLPDYITNGDILTIADVSGSMNGRPVEVSVSLAVYTAERNKGPFKGKFLTFSRTPAWQTLRGNTLREKVGSVVQEDWGANTDLEKVFRLILSTAVTHNVPAEDMPKVLAIISDMQFDQGVGRYTFTTHEAIKAKYRNAGYDLPLIVYWNVRASNGQPVAKAEIGTVLVSGDNLGVFKSLASADLDPAKMTPEYHMLQVLNGERYAPITI